VELRERVGAQAEAQRLERQHLGGRHVAEVHIGPVALDEPDLLVLLRRLEDELAAVDLVDDLVDQPGASASRMSATQR
jgi:hypothetical protein